MLHPVPPIEEFQRVLEGGCDALLINPPYPRRFGGGLVPPIGLCYLAASLREAGSKPIIVDLAPHFPDYGREDAAIVREIVRHLIGKLRAKPPLLIGVGPLVTANLRSSHDIIEVCRKETSSLVITGGPLCSAPGISSVSKHYLDVDLFVAGDGEAPLVSIWQGLTRQSSSFSSPGIGCPGQPEPPPFREHNLDLLPLPARDLLRSDLYKCSARRDMGEARMTAAFLSRGCPYSCSFCAAPLSSGKSIRRLSSARITQELSACDRAGIEHIVFYDDCLFVKAPSLNHRVLSFAESIAAARWNGTFQLELRCDAVSSLSDEALNALINVGCRQINMGIEKGHVAGLERLRKRLSPETAREACEKIANSGLRAAGTFIIGGPGERKSEMEATIDFALSLPLDFAQFNPMAVYPGTTLFDEMFSSSSDWLSLCLDDELSPLGDILWRSEETPLNIVLDSVEYAYTHFYTDERLERVLSRLPGSEREGVTQTYYVLSKDRARSWRERNLSEDAPLEPLTC
jgi:anaerobic magnesium-protoporphyrin IX monomethyl ester cyclase